MKTQEELTLQKIKEVNDDVNLKMNGNELITITISDGIDNKNQISSRYSVQEADRFLGTYGEYHLMMIDNLMKRFKENSLL